MGGRGGDFIDEGDSRLMMSQRSCVSFRFLSDIIPAAFIWR